MTHRALGNNKNNSWLLLLGDKQSPDRMSALKFSMISFLIFDLILIAIVVGIWGWRIDHLKNCRNRFADCERGQWGYTIGFGCDYNHSYQEKYYCTRAAGLIALYTIIVTSSVFRNILGWTIICTDRLCAAIFYLIMTIVTLTVSIILLAMYNDWDVRNRDGRDGDLAVGILTVTFNSIFFLFASWLICFQRCRIEDRVDK